MKGASQIVVLDYYIIKPFSLHFLKVVINTLIKNREMLREHYSSECSIDFKQNNPGNLDKRFLNELNAFIDSHISDQNMRIDDISKEIGMSRVQLYRKVKALLGCRVNELILDKRLIKTRYILTQGNSTISEVAYKSGFSSPSYFSTLFKKRFNISPKDNEEIK